jgi:hypothetical protein
VVEQWRLEMIEPQGLSAQEANKCTKRSLSGVPLELPREDKVLV